MSNIRRVMPSNVDSLVLFALSYPARSDVIVHRDLAVPTSLSFARFVTWLQRLDAAGVEWHLQIGQVMIRCYARLGQRFRKVSRVRGGGGRAAGVRGRRARMGAPRRPSPRVAFSNVASICSL